MLPGNFPNKKEERHSCALENVHTSQKLVRLPAQSDTTPAACSYAHQATQRVLQHCIVWHADGALRATMRCSAVICGNQSMSNLVVRARKWLLQLEESRWTAAVQVLLHSPELYLMY